MESVNVFVLIIKFMAYSCNKLVSGCFFWSKNGQNCILDNMWITSGLHYFHSYTYIRIAN